MAVLDHGVGKNGGGKTRHAALVVGGPQLPFRLGGSLPANKTKVTNKGLLEAEALPNSAAPAVFKGLSGAQARRKVHMAPRSNAYKNLGQGDGDGRT